MAALTVDHNEEQRALPVLHALQVVVYPQVDEAHKDAKEDGLPQLALGHKRVAPAVDQRALAQQQELQQCGRLRLDGTCGVERCTELADVYGIQECQMHAASCTGCQLGQEEVSKQLLIK